MRREAIIFMSKLFPLEAHSLLSRGIDVFKGGNFILNFFRCDLL